jgi:gliding motility-associated-like protein
MRILKWLILTVIIACTCNLYGQWCCFDSSFQILDKSTINVRLLISGAVNNNLASPNQGVCGVKVKFQHKFIGDVTMDLISPSGQRIRLIGPNGNSGNSSFSKWFVSFVPCASVAIPDPGFKKKWDNIQSWGILGKFYSGTYYPQNGCLEDFNSGTVNGTWTLSVTDDEKFYEGLIESFCLLFCDQSGINCEDCSPNGGLFAHSQLDYCQGDLNLSNVEEVSFPVFNPDTAYAYKYIISQNDTILELKDLPDLSTYPVGEYLLCGISYLKSDSVKLPLRGSLVSKYKSELVSNLIGICAELSKNCLNIYIHPSYALIKQNVTICRGDSFLIGGQVYNQSGVYSLFLKSTFGCDSNISLDLKVIDLKIIAGNIDSLDCKRNKVAIDISSSIRSSNTIIEWSTLNGNFNSLSDSVKPVIDKEGIYKVVFKEGNCMDSSEFTIFKKDDIPELRVYGDTLTCFKKSVDLIAKSSIPDLSYNWSDGVVTLGQDSVIQVVNAGTYYVTITDLNGCSNFESISVSVDTAKPLLNLEAGVITCKDSLAILKFSTSSAILNWLWQGPNSFQSNQRTPFVRTAGNYQIAAQGENGCIAMENILVKSIRYIPDFLVQPDTLKCSNNKTIVIDIRTNSVIDSLIYHGPSGFYNRDLNPVITQAGTYQILLTDTSGCVLDTSIEILIDTMKASFKLSTSILNCSNDSVQLILKYSSMDTLNLIQWSGPPGFSSPLQNPYVKEAGLYTVRVTAPNGCISQDTISVIQDSQKPVISISAGQLDCNNDKVKIDATVLNAINYHWTGPNAFQSMLEDPVVRDSGVYKLVVTGLNGCMSEKSIEVIADKRSPVSSVVSGILNCKTDSVLLKLIHAVTLDSVQWTGPGNLKSNLDSFYVHLPGFYRVYGKGINGCIDSVIIQVGIDTLAPVFTLNADTLSCKNANVLVSVTIADTSSGFLWRTPSGGILASKNITVTIPGWYQLTVTSANGCVSIDSVEVIDRRNNPDFIFNRDSIICSDSIAELAIRSKDLNLSYLWNGPNGFVSTDSMVQVTANGWYFYTVTNSFQCKVKDSFLVKSYLQKPKVFFSNPVFDCLTKVNPFLDAILLDSLDLYEWIYPSGLTIQNTHIPVTTSGMYIFRGVNEYGCLSDDTLNVVFDTMHPVINFVLFDSLNCARQQIVPNVETIPAGMTYQWSGPGGFISSLPNPLLKTAGTYFLKITGANFCYADTSLVLVADTMPPSIQALGGTITCAAKAIKLGIQSTDSLSSFIWQSPVGTIYNIRTPMVSDSGWYIVIVKGRNECLSIDSAYVSENTKSPVLKLNGVSIPCSPDSAAIGLESKDSILNVQWSGPNGFMSMQRNPFVKDTGFYYVVATGTNNCTSRDSVLVDDNRRIPLLNASGGKISCKDSIIQLNAVVSPSIVKFIWTGPGVNDSFSLKPLVHNPGFYTISIVDTFGCKNDTTIEVVIDTLKPVIQIAALDSLICEQQKVRLVNLNIGLQYQYLWSSVDGMIGLIRNRDTVIVDGPGIYELVVLDTVNGCIQKSGYPLKESKSDLTGLELQVIPPLCFGENTGQILIDSIRGGQSPFLYSTDGKNFDSVLDLSHLNSGNTTLFVKDKYGCIYDTLINIPEPMPLTLYLGRDTSIRLGQSYSILPVTNANTALLKLISWTPAKDLDCSDCFNVLTSPKNTIRYVMKITDDKGCIAEDDIVISIVDKPSIYLPNVFSPNKDNINDFVTIVSGEDEVNVKAFAIFDRWGNLLFSRENFQVSGTLDLWDGTVKGEPMNPGVYVYKIEIQLINGKNYQQAGDITLIR